jgi:hypothetical protein
LQPSRIAADPYPLVPRGQSAIEPLSPFGRDSVEILITRAELIEVSLVGAARSKRHSRSSVMT